MNEHFELADYEIADDTRRPSNEITIRREGLYNQEQEYGFLTISDAKSFKIEGWADTSEFAERISLRAVPRILTGEDAILVKFSVYEENVEAIVGVTVQNDQTRLGIYPVNMDNILPGNGEYVSRHENVEELLPVELDSEKAVPVDRTQLVRAIIDWVTVELDGIEDEDDPPFCLRKPAILRRLRDDAEAMLSVYRDTGSLDEYEVSRTEEDLRAFIFENVDLPKMREYIEENDPLPEFLETALSEYDEIEYKLSKVAEHADWLSRELLTALREVDDERGIAAAQFWLPVWYEDEEFARLAADLLGHHIESEEARNQLRQVAEHHEEESKRRIAKGKLEKHGYSVD